VARHARAGEHELVLIQDLGQTEQGLYVARAEHEEDANMGGSLGSIERDGRAKAAVEVHYDTRGSNPAGKMIWFDTGAFPIVGVAWAGATWVHVSAEWEHHRLAVSKGLDRASTRVGDDYLAMVQSRMALMLGTVPGERNLLPAGAGTGACDSGRCNLHSEAMVGSEMAYYMCCHLSTLSEVTTEDDGGIHGLVIWARRCAHPKTAANVVEVALRWLWVRSMARNPVRDWRAGSHDLWGRLTP
jgi:hypothetical protein